MKRLLRFCYTVKDLRWQQWWYRAWHPLKRRWYRPPALPPAAREAAQSYPLFQPFHLPPPYACQPAQMKFAFLNRAHVFREYLDWNFQGYGLLWTFHLNYFDWLEDETLGREERLESLQQYAADRGRLHTGLASYPSSVRLINAIRFLGANERPPAVVASLWEDACRVAAFPERHLMANHLLENAFALFHAAHFFNEKSFYTKSSRWFAAELKEQILADGGHVERSPAYHLHVLMRLMQCLELIAASPRFPDKGLTALLRHKAERMLGWVRAFGIEGNIPHFGDSNDEMAPPPALLWQLADRLKLQPAAVILKESGYRKRQIPGWTVWLNAGTAAPVYQPGHSHADPLSFLAFYRGTPFLTSAGVSTYENNRQRHWERSTAAHSTPVLNNQNASEVWSAFRMGRKAKVTLLKEAESKVQAIHNGYKYQGITVKCTLQKIGEKLQLAYQLAAEDKKDLLAISCFINLYIHPTHKVQVNQGKIMVEGQLLCEIKTNLGISLFQYSYAPGFNRFQEGTLLTIGFTDSVVLTLLPLKTYGN